MKLDFKQEVNWFVLISILALSVFMFVAPFYKGLFNAGVSAFEGPIHVTLIGFSILMILMGIHFLKQWVHIGHRELISIVALLFPFICLISAIGSASTHHALMEVHVKILWAFMFSLGAFLAQKSFGSKSIQYLIVGSGYILVVYGLMNWLGNAHYTDAVLWYNKRLSNVFQYPNAYAAYLSIIYFSSLALLDCSRKWFTRYVHAFMLTPILLSFLLTLSRAAMVSLAVGFLLLLVFFNRKKQLLFLLYALLSGIAALLLYNYVFELGIHLHNEYSIFVSLKGWLVLFLGSALVGTVITAIHEKTGDRANSAVLFNKKNTIIPLVIFSFISVCVLLIVSDSHILQYLPDQIKNRVSGISAESSSLYQRNTFYKDSWEIIKDYMIKGTGGGGWITIYHAYKSYPYISNQAHNFYFQYVVETGLVGFVFLVAFLLYWSVIVIRRFIKHPINDVGSIMFPVVAATLLIHSFFDFDMSYVYLSAIVFLVMGASVAGGEKPALNLRNAIQNRKVIKYFYAASIIVLGIYSFSYNVKAFNANQIYNHLYEPKSVQEAMDEVNKLLDLMPNHPDYHQANVNLLMQLYQQTGDDRYRDEIEKAIRNGKRANPYDAGLIELEYLYLLGSEQFDDALGASLKNIERYPWEIKWYERSIHLATQLGSVHEGSKRDEYWNIALGLADEVRRKHASILELPSTEQGGAKTFTINSEIASQLAQIYYRLGKHDETIDLLKPFLTEQTDLNLMANRQIVRYYLVSTVKKNETDQYWWDKLIETDPSEEELLHQLLE